MKLKKILFLSIVPILIIFSTCSQDNTIPPEPIRDIATQAMEDNETILSFLRTHFYNYEDFLTPENYNTIAVTIDTIANDNATKTSLYDFIFDRKKGKIITVDIENPAGENITHKLYYLGIYRKEGDTLKKPTIADSVYVNYRGILTNREEFDSSQQPLWLNLLTTVRGFSEGLVELSAGTYTENSNGTISFRDFDKAIIVMPSRLAYFDQRRTNIPAYSPLVFIIDLYTVEIADHDNDGIPSIEEDINNDKNLNNDDTDGDSIPNFRDTDDDGGRNANIPRN